MNTISPQTINFHINQEQRPFIWRSEALFPINWFGDNIHNITAIVGKNGAGKSNLIDCIIKALCGQGDGAIFYKYNNLIYSNIPNQVNDYNFDFKVERFDRFGRPTIFSAVLLCFWAAIGSVLTVNSIVAVRETIEKLLQVYVSHPFVQTSYF